MMISSVVARLNGESESSARIIEQISIRPEFETGTLVDKRMLPITIEAETGLEMESATKWLQELEGVEFVDVVFVHFEDEPDRQPRPIR